MGSCRKSECVRILDVDCTTLFTCVQRQGLANFASSDWRKWRTSLSRHLASVSQRSISMSIAQWDYDKSGSFQRRHRVASHLQKDRWDLEPSRQSQLELFLPTRRGDCKTRWSWSLWTWVRAQNRSSQKIRTKIPFWSSPRPERSKITMTNSFVDCCKQS